MNRIKRNRAVKFSSMSLALLSTMSLVSGGASAKEHKVKGSDNQAHVVAHISFSGLSAVDMVMQRKVNDTYYLYVQHSTDQRHLDYRYHQARSSKNSWSNLMARSSRFQIMMILYFGICPILRPPESCKGSRE